MNNTQKLDYLKWVSISLDKMLENIDEQSNNITCQMSGLDYGKIGPNIVIIEKLTEAYKANVKAAVLDSFKQIMNND